ncbi:hypothetical protein [uncultured Lactobacillus sp.]|uniref:hypothetical protein n=1 Tax=uncultured Lactobacillus sp. TaxID=153152 RepID=UPI00261D111C|nr:hypothetical protein [uncultured Lactobacillus sp.]
MQNWALTICCLVAMSAGFFELYKTFKFYKADQKEKLVATAPYVIYFGTFFSGVFIIVPILFLMGDTNLQFPRWLFIILGEILVIVAFLMYKRGHQMSKKLSKNESNLAVWQIYLISTVVLFTGIANMFR